MVEEQKFEQMRLDQLNEIMTGSELAGYPDRLEDDGLAMLQ
jgi:hypothetical protein